MKKYFDTKLLSKEDKKVYRENSKVLSPVLKYLENKYDYDNIEDTNLLLFYSFIEIESALTIYVDDVGKALSKVRARMDKAEKTPPVVAFLTELKKIEAKEKRIRLRLERLMKMDYGTLTLREKIDVAYELADSKNKEHSALAAEYFLKLYNETSKLYYYCIYANMLYESGNKDKALIEYEKILAFPKDTRLENREHFTLNIYQDRLDYYKGDKDKFRAVWEEAKANSYIQQNSHFPMAYTSITQVAEMSFKYEFYDICEEMIGLMKVEKLAIPSKIKEYYNL